MHEPGAGGAKRLFNSGPLTIRLLAGQQLLGIGQIEPKCLSARLEGRPACCWL